MTLLKARSTCFSLNRNKSILVLKVSYLTFGLSENFVHVLNELSLLNFSVNEIK